MGFVESIFGKIHHVLINFSCHFLTDALCRTPRYAFLFVAINKIGALLLHNGLFFLAHGAAHQIAPAQRITAQIAHNLHNLLLIYDTAVGGRQNRLKLRTGIRHLSLAVFALDIFGNKIHGTRAVQRNTRDDIL